MQELHLVELGDTVDQPRHLATEAALQLRHGYIAVFRYVVAQRRDQRGDVHMDAGQRLGHGQRVIDVRLARLAHLRGVGFGREHVGTPNRLNVWRRKIFLDVVEEGLRIARSDRCSGRHGKWSQSLQLGNPLPYARSSRGGAASAGP